MIATLIALAATCALSLAFILVIPPFASAKLFMVGCKVFDIVVQDQYIVIRRRYYIRFFPETRDCASWNDYSFNKRNQMIRLIAFPFLCAAARFSNL